MANETTYADNMTLAAAVNAEILPVFESVNVMKDLVVAFNPSAANTRTQDIPKSGNVTAAVVGEGVAATPQTLTDTKVSLTIQKAVVVTKPTAEALRFTTGTKEQRHAQLGAAACAKKFERDALALAAGFSQSVDAGVSATVAKLQEALFMLAAADLPTTRAAMIGLYKVLYQLEADIRTGGNAIYGNPTFSLQPLNNAGNKRGYRGELFGCELFQTGNSYVDTAPTPDDNVSLVFNPDWAIAALYPSGTTPQFETEISGELGFLESVKFIKTTMWYQLGEMVDTAGIGYKTDI